MPKTAWCPWFAAAVVVCLIAPATALTVTDPHGDAEPVGPAVPLDGFYDSLDIAHATFAMHNATHLLFSVDLHAGPEGHVGYRNVSFSWRYGSVEYRTEIGRLGEPGVDYPISSMYRREETRWRVVAGLPGQWNNTGYTLLVPAASIQDEHQLPLAPGRSLEDVQVRVDRRLRNVDQPIEAIDFAPDEPATSVMFGTKGSATASFEVISTDSFRYSNGEATSFVYEVNVVNREAQDLTVSVGWQAPSEWSVRVAPRLQLAPNANMTVPVIVTIPFEHAHGATKTANITFTSLDGASAAVALGVHWLSVPHLSGHHPVLYVHSKMGEGIPLPSAWGWVNADPEDAEAQAEPLPGYSDDAGHKWGFSMLPRQIIGMATEADRPTPARLVLDLPFSIDGAILDLKVEAGQGMSGSTLTHGRSEAIDLPSGRAVIELEMVAAEAVVLPPSPNPWFVVRMVLEHDIPAGAASVAAWTPTIDTQESHIELPMLEYHDPVPQAVAALGQLKVHAAPILRANPGDVVQLDVVVENSGSARTVRLDTEGPQAEWVEARSIDVAAGTQKATRLAVAVPDDIAPGTVGRFFVVAHDAGSGVLALAPVEVMVISVEEEDIKVETVPPRKSSSIGWVPIVLAGAGLLHRHRRG